MATTAPTDITATGDIPTIGNAPNESSGSTVDGGEHAATPAAAAKSPPWGFFRISYRGVTFFIYPISPRLFRLFRTGYRIDFWDRLSGFCISPGAYTNYEKTLRGRFDGCQACSSSSKALASFRSSVSKPSVNQP